MYILFFVCLFVVVIIITNNLTAVWSHILHLIYVDWVSLCFVQVYSLEVTWSNGFKSQTEVNSSSLADWRVGQPLKQLLFGQGDFFARLLFEFSPSARHFDAVAWTAEWASGL